MTSAAQPPIDSPARRQRGFSLVELMVAMTIGLFVLAALGYVLLGARSTFNTLDALSRMQENARFAFEIMAADIRMAGFTGGPADGGSPSTNIGTVAVGLDPKLVDLYGTPLFGYAPGGVYPPGIAGRVGLTGDALTVVRADSDREWALDPAAPLSCSGLNNCVLASWPPSGAPRTGGIYVAADYTHTAVFRATGVNRGARVVSHGDLGPFGGDVRARKLSPLRGTTYFIATNPGGEPALYRLGLDADGDGSTPAEVVEGVENMQILYGLDTVNTPPSTVNAYSAAGALAAGDWAKVLSVRMTLGLVSKNGITTTGDGRMRKTLTNTIAVRNRLQ